MGSQWLLWKPQLAVVAVIIVGLSEKGSNCHILRGTEIARPFIAGPGITETTKLNSNANGSHMILNDAQQLAHHLFMDWLSGINSIYRARKKEGTFSENGENVVQEGPGSWILVDIDGCGNFSSVQEAVNFVPRGNKERVVIYINPGIYEEKVVVPSEKPFITFWGGGQGVTVITWNAASRDLDATGKPFGTYNSATVGVHSAHFVARNISFQNTAPRPAPGMVGWQAVALRISGDKAAFYSCGFYGAQDTLYDHKGRHYFHDCYIEGSIDFIFGGGLSLYSECMLHAIDCSGSLTAQKRKSPKNRSGFAFMNCTVTGSALLFLGRAWGKYSTVVFAYTYMDNIILPPVWSDWNDPQRQKTVYYGEFKCWGPGAQQNARVAWSHELTDTEAEPFLSLGFIDGEDWLMESQ